MKAKKDSEDIVNLRLGAMKERLQQEAARRRVEAGDDADLLKRATVTAIVKEALEQRELGMVETQELRHKVEEQASEIRALKERGRAVVSKVRELEASARTRPRAAERSMPVTDAITYAVAGMCGTIVVGTALAYFLILQFM